jgi:hypothetical protein
MRERILYIVLAVLGNTILNSQYSQAQNMLLTINYTLAPLNSGFDGNTKLSSNGNIYLLPKLVGGSGFGVSVGAGDQWRNYVYAVFKYSLNFYEAFYKNIFLGRSYQNSFGTIMRIYPNKIFPGKADKYVNPKFVNYFLLGADISYLRVRDSHYLDSIPQIKDDAVFSSIFIPLGIGISFKPLPAWTIDIDGAYRLGFLYYMRGASEKESHEISQNIWVGGFRFEAGVTYYISLKRKKR